MERVQNIPAPRYHGDLKFGDVRGVQATCNITTGPGFGRYVVSGARASNLVCSSSVSPATSVIIRPAHSRCIISLLHNNHNLDCFSLCMLMLVAFFDNIVGIICPSVFELSHTQDTMHCNII